MDQSSIERAEEILGHRFQDRELLERALTHASLVESRHDSNERMEFLGDAVLGLVVCDYLYRQFSDLLEGEMTKIKSSAVSRRQCAELGEDLGLDELLRLGKGMSNRAALPGSVVAAAFESLIGALFLDAGLDAARAFILRVIEPRIAVAARSGHQSNFKSVLQQTAQQVLNRTPQYIVLDEQGPDHAKCFEIRVEIDGRQFDSAWGPSKKQAEQEAALQALLELDFAERMANGEIAIRPLQGVEEYEEDPFE
ncbi:MAG: ribonuclease III [Planctomycetota bacterium]|jgi:ribonuclease-3